MGRADLNPWTKGLPAETLTTGFNGLVLCYCDAQPGMASWLNVSSDIQLIEVKQCNCIGAENQINSYREFHEN
jgi:hypothetical protein